MFDAGQIKIYLFDDLKTDGLDLVQNMIGHLEVDDSFVPDISISYNPSGFPKNRVLHWALSPNRLTSALKKYLPSKLLKPLYGRCLGFFLRNLNKPQLPAEIRGLLIDDYREDILQLEDLNQQDLSNWLE